MKNLFQLLICWLFLSACTEKKTTSGKDVEKIDTTQSAMVTVESEEIDSFPNVKVDISADELKDDSVFADGSIPTSWVNAGISDVRGLKQFLKQAQLWVMYDNKEKLASIVRYPLKNIKTEQDLITAYDKVFTKEVKLSFATINFNQISRNQKGVMLQNGKVWITQSGNEFFIFAINP